MKRAKLIYNPVSGAGSFAANLDRLIKHLQEHDWQVVPHRTAPDVPVKQFFGDCGTVKCDAVLAAGGDGTLHQVANAILLKGWHLQDPNVTYLQVKAVTISSARPVTVDVDGETDPQLPVTIEVLPKALEIFVPEV